VTERQSFKSLLYLATCYVIGRDITLLESRGPDDGEARAIHITIDEFWINEGVSSRPLWVGLKYGCREKRYCQSGSLVDDIVLILPVETSFARRHGQVATPLEVFAIIVVGAAETVG
jgi:hypothetical protein